MEKEKVVDNIQAQSSSPIPTGLPINWGLITGPVPEPVFLTPPSLSTQLLLTPQSLDVRTLQTKAKSLTQRRTRGRDRERERERLDAEVSAGQISSEVLLRQNRPRAKSQPVSLPAHSWRSGASKVLSSSDEEKEEVEVRVRLQIHSPPAEAQGLQVSQERGEDQKDDRSDRNDVGKMIFLTGRPYGLGGGTSLESLLSDNSSSSKDDPSPSSPRPVFSFCSPGTTSAQTITSSTTSSLTPTAATSALTPTAATSALTSTVTTFTSTTSSISSTTSAKPARRWAPPKGFWREARPEALLLNSIDPNNIPSNLPLRDFTQIEAQAAGPLWNPKPKTDTRRSDVGSTWVDDVDLASGLKHNDSVECYLDRCEQKEVEGKGLCSSDSWESVSSQSGALSADEKLKVKQRAYARLRERKHSSRKNSEQSGEESASYHEESTHRVDCEGAQGGLYSSDPANLAQGLEPYLRSLLVISDELPLSPRHEEAKRLLERARFKARSNHIKGDRPSRRSHSDQRPPARKQSVSESPSPTPVQKNVRTEDDVTSQTASGVLLVPNQRDTSPSDQGSQSRRYGCSPTRVRFEDESEKEAESRYLDRVRQRGRPGTPKSKSKENSNTDSSGSSSERIRNQRSVSMPPLQKQEDAVVSVEPATTVIKEIIVLVKKCEACGSVVREPQTVSAPSDPQKTEPQPSTNPEDSGEKPAPHWVKPEVSTRPKAPLTVTFAGAYVLGESKEKSAVWKSSGFGKLRRRSRKGESRLESGNGPYGPSWAQRRNSNPRRGVNLSRAVSFAPVTLNPNVPEASGGLRVSPTPSLPIKSAMKSSAKNRSSAGQSTVQFQMGSSQGGEEGSQHPALLDSAEARREAPVALTQGSPVATISSPVPCIRPSTLRYSPARNSPDLPAAELWDATPDGTAGLSGESGSGSESRLVVRSLAMSRAEDLRAELLRAEHLKAWEDNCDGSRKLDGRPKLFLRRFFSSIGLNSVGRLVKGGRSSSMEQLSLPTIPRASSASPSPTRRPKPAIRIQRTPSLQSLHTVLPLAQLRKASSVQSLERRTERSTILGEVQIPYGLAPSPDSPQTEIHRALSVEDVLPTRIVRPVGRVTQAFPDGTLLLELVRPPNGPFGFVISRGKGRPDTGVYVEKVGDGGGGGEGPYMGLLSIGDEILQVNGEVVAGLSLDQVTRLMTRESTASLRIMPARRNQR